MWLIGSRMDEVTGEACGPYNRIVACRDTIANIIASEMEQHSQITINVYSRSGRALYAMNRNIKNEIDKRDKLHVIHCNMESITCTAYAMRMRRCRWFDYGDCRKVRFIQFGTHHSLRAFPCDMTVFFDDV